MIRPIKPKERETIIQSLRSARLDGIKNSNLLSRMSLPSQTVEPPFALSLVNTDQVKPSSFRWSEALPWKRAL